MLTVLLSILLAATLAGSAYADAAAPHRTPGRLAETHSSRAACEPAIELTQPWIGAP